MPFKAILKELVGQVHGAQGAILLDWEGEAVEQHSVLSDYEIKFIGAHMGIILYNLKRNLNEELGDDDVKWLTLDLDSRRIAVFPVDRDYFVVLVLSPGSVYGLVRHEIEIAVRSIKEAF